MLAFIIALAAYVWLMFDGFRKAIQRREHLLAASYAYVVVMFGVFIVYLGLGHTISDSHETNPDMTILVMTVGIGLIVGQGILSLRTREQSSHKQY